MKFLKTTAQFCVILSWFVMLPALVEAQTIGQHIAVFAILVPSFVLAWKSEMFKKCNERGEK